MPLFYAFQHPIYQEIESRDFVALMVYPTEIKNVLDKNLAFTTTKESNPADGDFWLENKIKQHKLIAPKGQSFRGNMEDHFKWTRQYSQGK